MWIALGLLGFRKEWVPWWVAAGRAALGPVMILAAACGWNPLAMAGMVVTAQVSDIVDGRLARRWRCDTAAGALFDSIADTIFYVCAAIALRVARPAVWHRNGWLLAALAGLEVLRLVVELAKFGKVASYHTYLAKTWGIVLAVAAAAVFATPHAGALLPWALALGIACDAEGMAMSALLPVWRSDVTGLGAALKVRAELIGFNPPRASATSTARPAQGL